VEQPVSNDDTKQLEILLLGRCNIFDFCLFDLPQTIAISEKRLFW